VRWGLLITALLFAVLFLGARSLWDPDEGRYVAVALGMLDSGDWWSPRLNHEVLHYSKPPLTYWAIAAAVEALGRSEAAIRLPWALAFVGTITLVAAIARRLAPGTGILASVVYGTSVLPFVAMNVVTPDTLLAFVIALGMYGLVELQFADAPPRHGRLLLWSGFGLAFLCKGPPGLLPLLAVALLAFRRRDLLRGSRRVVSLPSLLVFLILALGWYAHEIAVHSGLAPYLLGSEVIGRLTSGSFRRNPGWAGLANTYLPVIVGGMLPWMPVALVRWLRRRPLPPDGSPDHQRLLLWGWLLLPLLVFAMVQSRLPLYLLPSAVPAALLIARGIGPLAPTPRLVAAVASWALLLLAGRIVAADWPDPRDGRILASQLVSAFGSRPSNVLFVEATARYSLAFYLGAEVEEIYLPSTDLTRRPPAYQPTAESLAEEFADQEPGRVLLSSPKYEEPLVAELRSLGVVSRRIGPVGPYAAVVIDETSQRR
jgi:4-amino-4-deoxy-L-arabinose transferase-like glycosyltransferase